MQANETHISLETAKLLKDCGIKGKFFFCIYDEADKDEEFVFSGPSHGYDWTDYPGYGDREIQYPAYTRQEILREHAEEFGLSITLTDFIIRKLRCKKYYDADIIFRQNCVLIK